MGLPEKKEKYTYKDYLTWNDDTSWELINGIPYNMSPSPSFRHQNVLGEIFGEFREFFKDKSCIPCISPLDVRLPEKNEKYEDIATIVQPDIFIVCDSSKLDDRGCLGAPDLIVEILSPSTAKKDMNEKMELYAKHGIKEYWIVLPYEDCIEVFKPDNEGTYRLTHVYAQDDTIRSNLFPGLAIKLPDIFKKVSCSSESVKEKNIL